MYVSEADGATIRDVSYLRTIDPLEAIAARAAINQFFGPVQEPAGTIPKPTVEVREPEWAVWIIGGGVALVIAAILSMALREFLPPMMPGLYLGVGGICVILAGVVYAKLAAVKVEPVTSPEKQVASRAQTEIKKQIDHCRVLAEKGFGPPAEHPREGRRAHLVGIGRKEWNGLQEVPIVEVKGDRIWAGVVHLVSIDLTPGSIAIRQLGLHLATGTVYNAASSRYLLTDVMTATHEERKLIATNAWEQAAALAQEIGQLDTKANKSQEKVQAEIARKKTQLQSLARTFEEPAGNKFSLTFNNGEKLELIVADRDLPNNKSNAGYPIGGKENLDAAVQMWAAINVAVDAAKHAHQSAVAGVKVGLDEYQKSVVGALSGVHSQLASLEGVMTDVLATLKAAMPPGSPPPVKPTTAATEAAGAVRPLLTNGHDAVPIAASGSNSDQQKAAAST